MAEAENVHVKLKQAILQIRTPVLRAESIEELWVEHISDVLEITDISDATTVDYWHQMIRRIVRIICKGGLEET